MKRFTLPVLLAAVCCLLVGVDTAHAISGAGAIALEFPIGARYNALGEAGTALSQDATAMWWNPGGLAFATHVGRVAGPNDVRGRVQFMHSKLVPDLANDIFLYWGGYVSQKWGGSFGFNMTFLSMGKQQGVDDNNNPTGIFSSNMWAAGLVYGTRITPNVGFGFGVKYFRDNLAPDAVLQDKHGGSGSTFAVDAGVLWKIPTVRANVGVAISNLGPNITHVDADQSDPLPRKATFGFAYGLYQGEATSLLLVGDYLVPLLNWDSVTDDYRIGLEFSDTEYGGGLEWSYIDSLFLRFGWKKGTGEIDDYTWGLGLDLSKWMGQKLSFGYASVPQAKGLQHVNRISMGFNF